MIRLVLLALILTTPAHAERWCNGTLTSDNVCKSNVPPMIVRCDYYDNRNSDPRGVGMAIDVLLSNDGRRNRHRRAENCQKEKPRLGRGSKIPGNAGAGGWGNSPRP